MFARMLAGMALLGTCVSAMAEETSELRVTGRPTAAKVAFGVASDMVRKPDTGPEHGDFTVAGMFSVRHERRVDQFAFGLVSEAWALPGSRSTLIGLESAVVNEEETNENLKVALNLVFKNRSDAGVPHNAPFNQNSIAMWITAQPGTGFERGIVFGTDALHAEGTRPAMIDLSDIPDDRIGSIDLIRIRHGVALRYDPATRTLVLHVDDAQQPATTPP